MFLINTFLGQNTIFCVYGVYCIYYDLWKVTSKGDTKKVPIKILKKYLGTP